MSTLSQQKGPQITSFSMNTVPEIEFCPQLTKNHTLPTQSTAFQSSEAKFSKNLIMLVERQALRKHDMNNSDRSVA